MKNLNNILKEFKGSLKNELQDVTKLKGEKLTKFCDVFNLPEDIQLYYNSYNMVITDKWLNDELKGFHKQDALVMQLLVPEHNVYLWVYQYFNAQIFESYLIDSQKFDFSQ